MDPKSMNGIFCVIFLRNGENVKPRKKGGANGKRGRSAEAAKKVDTEFYIVVFRDNDRDIIIIVDNNIKQNIYK